jgi:Spy/CpxP family protein refolding chaperone
MKRIGLMIGILLAIVALSATIVPAQPPQQQPPPPDQPRPPRPPEDPLGDAIFPPDLIMQHQRELQLTDDQKSFMRSEIQRTTTRFNELQWQLQDSMELLGETLKANAVNEQLALSQLDKVLESEREIKRLHMELGIRLKNKLTVEQQNKLQSLKQGMRPGGPRPGRGPMGPGGPGSGLGGPPPGQGQAPPDGVPRL